MPVGLLLFVCFVGFCLLLQLTPVPRGALGRQFSFWTSLVVNEQPLWVGLLLVASTALAFGQGDVDSVRAWVVVALVFVELAGLSVLLARAFRGRSALRSALADLTMPTVALNPERSRVGTLLLPFAFGRRRVERIADLTYGPAGKRNLLDLYRPRGSSATGPTLIYLHGGGFAGGGKRREGQLALYRLAARGWTCVSANYRLSPEAQFPDYVIDLKMVIGWVRREGVDLGADPERIFLAGGSAGGHIVSTAALADDLALQPGFEEDDTSVAGVIGLYGYYGGLEYGRLRPRGPLPSSPIKLAHPGAPPFLLVHGERDTVVPISNARAFASALSRAGAPVTLAELPGAQHSFDLLRSIRNEDVVDAIEDFAAGVPDRSVPGCNRG